jgi:PKD repeat protein
MISTSTIVLNSYVNFNCYAPAVLGNGYQDVEVLAILDYDSANAYINAAVLHASVYPSLPQGTPNDYTAYPYLKIRTNSGKATAVGLPWIIDSSYQVQNAAKMTIVLDSVSPEDQENVRIALSSIGLSNFTITLSAPDVSPSPTPTPTPSPTPSPGGSASASFTYTLNGLQASFTNTSTDPNPITGYHWDFGDGNTSSSQNPTYTYSAAGSYTVVLTITDNQGAQYTSPSSTLTVTAPAPTPG